MSTPKVEKRRRSSSASSSSSIVHSPTSKSSRPSDTPIAFTCTLPPTCHVEPSHHSTSASLDTHWLSYHAFVCHAPPILQDGIEGATKKGKGKSRAEDEEVETCRRIFPSERFLELHFRECHDPLASIKSERGEKIFDCFLPSPSCTSSFLTPKARRLHLIDKHDYPRQYFFGVTLWGVQDVLEKGGGMVRKEWKERRNVEKVELASGQPTEQIDKASTTNTLQVPPHLAPLPVKVDRKSADCPVDDIMDSLIDTFAETKIEMVPRSVRLAKSKAKVAVASVGSRSMEL